MASQRLHPGLIGAAVLCFALTAAFTAGVVSKSGEIRILLEGDPERPNSPTIAKLLSERSGLLEDIANQNREVQLRLAALGRADVELGKHLVYFNDVDLLGGISTPGHETDTVNGIPNSKLKDHRLALVQHAIVQSGTRLESVKTEYMGKARQTFPSLEQSIRKRQDELQTINGRISEADAVFQKDRQALVDKLDALTAEQTKNSKSANERKSLRLTRISQLEDRIRELLELDMRWLTEIDQVGSVLTVEERSSRVIIDLGSSERAFPGLLFQVFNYDKGTFKAKGMVEVIEVKEGISVCRILAQPDRRLFPIAKDDRIGNPTFNPRRPKTFVVAGEFNHFNKADLETFIRRSGGIVAEKLRPGVDYLVAGTRSDREQAHAREYQVLGMKEDQLLTFVQTLFAPK